MDNRTLEEKLDIVSASLAKLIDEHNMLEIKTDMATLLISDLAQATGMSRERYDELVVENMAIAFKQHGLEISECKKNMSFEELMESVGGSPNVH